MSDPKIAECSVAVRYRADDGYNSSVEFRVDYRRTKEIPPERPFINAIEELARLTALFGFEEEALKVFNEAR